MLKLSLAPGKSDTSQDILISLMELICTALSRKQYSAFFHLIRRTQLHNFIFVKNLTSILVFLHRYIRYSNYTALYVHRMLYNVDNNRTNTSSRGYYVIPYNGIYID